MSKYNDVSMMTNRAAVSALVLQEIGAVFRTGPGAGDVAAGAAHQLGRFPPTTSLCFAARQPTEVSLLHGHEYDKMAVLILILRIIQKLQSNKSVITVV